jgi:protein-S-isoprenylcysteine O-methyltransferase Ste14
MELLPVLKIGWFNGWLAVILLSLTEGIMFLAFPQKVVTRLFDRSGWSPKEQAYTIAGKLCAFVCLALLILTPLKIGNMVFTIGAILIMLGLIGLVKALFDFRNTALDEPVTRGLYRVSRHPQIVMSSLVILGACIAVGSLPALAMLMVAKLLEHFGIVAEEQVCLKQYGEAYRNYLQQVPRYFLFF